MSSQQSEADQFYADCSGQLFCFGTQDDITCTGTATDTDATPDCAAAFATNSAESAPWAGDGDTSAASCPAGCTYSATVNRDTETQGFWDQASLCETTATGCMAFDEIYTDGTDAVRKLWQVGDEYSFTVVATADETATNSFSLFGGDAPADLTVVTDLTDAPTDQANTNDDVLLGENPFPDDHTCPEEGTTSTPTPSCDGYACAEGNIAKAEPNSIFCAGECTADDCCNPTCGDVDDDGDGGSEADDLFACPTGQELKYAQALMLRQEPLAFIASAVYSRVRACVRVQGESADRGVRNRRMLCRRLLSDDVRPRAHGQLRRAQNRGRGASRCHRCRLSSFMVM